MKYTKGKSRMLLPCGQNRDYLTLNEIVYHKEKSNSDSCFLYNKFCFVCTEFIQFGFKIIKSNVLTKMQMTSSFDHNNVSCFRILIAHQPRNKTIGPV